MTFDEVFAARKAARANNANNPPQVPAPPQLEEDAETPQTHAHNAPGARGGPHIVYCPFNLGLLPAGVTLEFDDDYAPLHGDWEGRKKYVPWYHGQKSEILKGLDPSTTIYVVGHCCAGSSVLSDWRGTQALCAVHLAERLAGEGLDPAHTRMKLWACQGLESRVDKQGRTQEAFAVRFLRAMRRRGYKALTLYAYSAILQRLHHSYDIGYIDKNPTVAYPPARTFVRDGKATEKVVYKAAKLVPGGPVAGAASDYRGLVPDIHKPDWGEETAAHPPRCSIRPKTTGGHPSGGSPP